MQNQDKKPEKRPSAARGTALITGASSGMGQVFAQRLAAQGYAVILVARRLERLEALASELYLNYKIEATPLAADLACEEGVEKVEACIKSCPDLDLLINNAGFGILGNFNQSELEPQLGMIAVHVLASVRLCHAALPNMIARQKGAIINVSSLSAFLPLSGNATYGATKSYLNSFTQSLAFELKGSGVKVQALCPGFTYTGFHDTPAFDGTNFRSHIPKFMWMKAEDVVDQSLKALRHNRVIFIPGFKNRLFALAGQLGIVTLAGGLIGKIRSRM